jgi:hypothetical protein
MKTGLFAVEERDYGIDLQLERFDSDDATGDFIFVQVKGTDKAFKENVQLSGFPVDTVNYALMFDVPFFLFTLQMFPNRQSMCGYKIMWKLALKKILPSGKPKIA